MIKTIELDCAPGMARPDSFLPAVIAGTVLEGLSESAADATVSRLFGCWTWHFPCVSDDQWKTEIVPIIKPRIEALYNAGRIRYGSW